MKVIHTIPPTYDAGSRILLLGTLPSPKSREVGYPYSHPQNKMWPLLSDLLGEPLPQTNEEKRSLLLRNHIAMWDVLHSCDIQGADDGSIKNPVPNDLELIYRAANIRATFTTGSKSTALYRRFFQKEPIPLPSTSPANCRFYNYEKLRAAYSVILEYLS